MSRSRSSAQPELPDESRWSDRGDTLIEVLLALVILGIAGVALLTGFATSITASGTHRNLATLDSSVRSASNEVIAQVQQSKNSVFGANTCTGAAANPTTNTSFSPTWNLSGSFTVTSYNVQYWSGTGFSNSCTNPYGPQLWTMNIGTTGYSSQVTTVIYDASAPAVTGGVTASKLVFMQPTSTGSGTVNAAVSPQPIVAVEDGTTNSIVYSDASSVTLTASGGTGTLSNNCAGVENNGVVSFSGCSFSAPGTYTVTASDGSLTSATASYSITTAPVAKVVFTTSPVTQVASASAGTSMVTVQEQDAFGTPVPGALTVNLSSSSSTGIFSLSSGSTSAVTSVSIPAGKSSASFYYGDTTAGSPTLSAAASGLQTGSQTETINGATPVKVTLAATPASAGVSTTTDVALGLQLVDQFGNNTTAGSSGVSLTLSTSSTKGFFNANNNASGSATATVAFANGTGTATEYYGDKTVGTPTVTAKNGTSTWGTAPLTMTVGPPATITLNSGSGQSTLVNTGFTNPLVTTVTDAFGNPVPGASVTFSAPANGASVTFGTCAGGNPQTYQCVATTNASGQATSPAFTANTTSGGPYSIAASAGSTNTVNFTTTNTPGSPTQVVITPTPTTPSASSTTNTALGFQLADQYGNNATAGTGGISLSLSTSSSKGVFSASNNATGSATATISFASGAGTATEYYGDQTAGTPTITAKKLTATWGTASPTVVAKTTGDNMTIVAGNSQSATVGAAFGTALQVQDVDQFGNPVSGANVTFSAPASGASGTFATCSGGNPQTYQCVVATNASGQASAPTLTANTVSGGAYSVTTAVSGDTTPPTFSETNTPGSPTQVYITPTPSTSSASSTTNTALGFQLVDLYGNNTTAGTGGISLAMSSSSSTGVFSASNNASGSATATISFANGVGTATEYYGDQTAGSPTVTAKKLTAIWGTASPTIVAKTTGDTMTIVAGNGQSTPVSTAFGTALEVQDVDQYGNPVSGVSVTFSAPTSNASGTFASGGNCTSNPHTYQCVVTTNASGQATASTFTANATAGNNYSVTLAASGVASPPSFSESNIHVTAASVASGTGTNSITTGSFTMTSGTTYVVSAFASNNGSISTPTPTVSGSSAPSMTLITTNTFGGTNSPNCNDSTNCYEWAWSFNATASSSATVSISFTGSPTGDVADVIALGGNSTSTPVVQSSTASGCNSNNCNNNTKTVTGNLSNAPAAGDITLQILGSDDAMGTAPTWSTLNSNLYFRTASAASMDVNLASPGQQNETTSTSASGYTGSKDWATIALEIGAP